METGPSARATSPLEHHDPLLAKFLETATFDCDWETLRHHLYLALLAALPVFLDKPPPAAFPQPAPSLSPTASRDPSSARPDSGRSTPLSDGADEHADDSLRPSTPGGLVIPPFPPLDPKRRRPTVTVISADSERLNGAGQMQRGIFEDDYDEEVVIGGRKLQGWMDAEEGRKEVDKIARKLEELTFPPFTLQRLTELLTSPTRLHSSLGKFLRAVDKMLVVTTAYAPPSYTYVPPPNHLATEELSSPRMSPASASTDMDSTVPPGSMTPMFSPIPFLSGGDGVGEHMMDTRARVDEPMSPLVLENSEYPQPSERSPTPEPEEDADRVAAESAGAEGEAMETTEGEAEVAGPSTTADPGNQPYLGRVDELDAGPITSNGHHEEENEAGGVGETGRMTPHGMSDRPVALSSTTVLDESEREIAPLPRRAESEAGEAGDADAAEGGEGAEADGSAS